MDAAKLIDFIRNHDFAFQWGAGCIYCEDPEYAEYLVSFIKQDGMLIQEIENVEECCPDLLPEAENGCKIYEIWNYGKEPMYISYYSD